MQLLQLNVLFILFFQNRFIFYNYCYINLNFIHLYMSNREKSYIYILFYICNYKQLFLTLLNLNILHLNVSITSRMNFTRYHIDYHNWFLKYTWYHIYIKYKLILQQLIFILNCICECIVIILFIYTIIFQYDRSICTFNINMEYSYPIFIL